MTVPHDAAETLALRALAHIVGDPDLGQRFLDLTGLDVATLRARAGTPDVLAAVLSFLAGHEQSLVTTAHALEVKPEELIRAQAVLG